MDAFARWLARHPLAVVVVNLAVTAALGAFALHLRIENSLESMLPAHDPKVEYYAQTRAIFGSDAVGVVGMRAQNIFAPATIEKIARVTDLIAKVEGVERVLSIANAVDPAADVLHPPRLLPRIPPEPAEVEALKKKLAATPLYGKNLVSDDFTGAAINVFFKNLTDAQYLDLGIDRKIGAILAAERGPRDGAPLRAAGGRRAAGPDRRARLHARLAAAHDLGGHHRDRLRLAHREPHHRHLGSRALRGGGGRLLDPHLPDLPARRAPAPALSPALRALGQDLADPLREPPPRGRARLREAAPHPVGGGGARGGGARRRV